MHPTRLIVPAESYDEYKAERGVEGHYSHTLLQHKLGVAIDERIWALEPFKRRHEKKVDIQELTQLGRRRKRKKKKGLYEILTLYFLSLSR